MLSKAVSEFGHSAKNGTKLGVNESLEPKGDVQTSTIFLVILCEVWEFQIDIAF